MNTNVPERFYEYHDGSRFYRATTPSLLRAHHNYQREPVTDTAPPAPPTPDDDSGEMADAGYPHAGD